MIDSNYAAKSFSPLPMKRCSASRRCILIKTFQRYAIALSPLSSSQKPHRRSSWQMASTILSLATLQWTTRTTAEHMDSVCPPSIVKRATSGLVGKVQYTSIKAFLSCHLTWMHVRRPLNLIWLSLNWNPLWIKFFKMSIDRLNFPDYSIGAARTSVLENVQLELTEIPDVTRRDLET